MGRFKPIKNSCEYEHEWDTIPGAMYQGHWCIIYAEKKTNKKRKKAAEQEFPELLQTLKYTLLSNYENNTKQVQIKFNNKHRSNITPKYFKRLVNQKI